MPSFFSDHFALVDWFLHERPRIVERIEQTLLNVRDKDTSRRRDRPFFEQTFEAGFFAQPGLPPELSRLKGQLSARHLADGFEPVASERTFLNELDPLELILRAYEHWDRHRWPGRSGRLSYAQTLYAVFMLRLVEGLSLRIWDEGLEHAASRLDDLQQRLDRLNGPESPAVLVREAGWLIQTSQGPLTKQLRPYLEVAERISSSLAGPRRLAVHKAGARLAGGHLRSQLRYRVWQTGRPPDDPENLAFTRNSNALDSALLVRDLVPLLEAYRTARDERHDEDRLDLADAILQGVSADPELYLARLDLLTPYVMIEGLFVERTDRHLRYTAMGESALSYLRRYGALIGELAASIRQDAVAFDPAPGSYSPQGIAYGFIADVMSNIAQDTLGQPSCGLSLEDMFISRGGLDKKLARARRWESLPRRPGERAHFDHSDEAAAESHARVTAALEARALHPHRPNASDRRDAKVFVTTPAPPEAVPADDYCVTSDAMRARPDGPSLYPRDQLVVDRNEGRYLASGQSDDGEWFGISKVILTIFTSNGMDTVINHVPDAVASVVLMTCPEIVVVPDRAVAARAPDRD